MTESKRRELRFKIITESKEGVEKNNTVQIDAAINKAREQYLLEVVEYIQGYKEFVGKNYPAALKHMEEAIRIDPTFIHAYVWKGIILIEMNDYETAIKFIDYSIQNLMLLDYSVFYVNKGFALQKMKRLDEAMSCYLRAIEDNINYEHAYRNAVSLAIEKEDFTILLDITEQIRSNFSGKPSFLSATSGYLLTQVEKMIKVEKSSVSEKLLAESGKLIEIAVAKEPEDNGILYNYACFLSRSGKADQALETLEKIFKKTPLNNERIRLQKLAVDDADFVNLREDPRFKKLLT